MVRTTNYQQSKVMGVVSSTRAWAYERIDDLTTYLSLKKENERLQEENTLLRNQLNHYLAVDTLYTIKQYDTIKRTDYIYKSARIVNTSTNKVKNRLVINVGQDQNVGPDMGVISSDGVVGVVTKTSDSYAVVLPIINPESHTSCRLVRSNAEGMLSWDAVNYREALLTGVPQHIDVQVGDTIVTSSNSNIYPPNILVGTVKSYEVRSGNLYEIKVSLSVDYKRLRNVYVVKSDSYAEIDSLLNGSER
jgi:rod shape-determining protein MreC